MATTRCRPKQGLRRHRSRTRRSGAIARSVAHSGAQGVLMVGNPLLHRTDDEVVTPFGETTMAHGSPTGFPLDVLGTLRHASEDGGHEVFTRLEAVLIGDEAPAPAHVAAIALRCRLDERPAEVGDVLDASARLRLLPVDETDRLPVPNDYVPGLQIVVDHALVSVHEARGQIVEAPYDPGELTEVDPLTRRCGDTWDPGEDLAAGIVHAERSGSPPHASVFEMSQDAVHQFGVRTRCTPDRVANAHRAVHGPSVAGAAGPGHAHCVPPMEENPADLRRPTGHQGCPG